MAALLESGLFLSRETNQQPKTPRTTQAIVTKSKESYVKVRKSNATVQKLARITSKGQITVPRDIRRTLGVGPGDRLLFESDSKGVRVRPMRAESPFEKYRGIGNPGVPSGRKAVRQWVRQLRGE